MALVEGQLDAAVTAALQLRQDDFEDAGATEAHLQRLRSASAEQRIAAIAALSRLSPRRSA